MALVNLVSAMELNLLTRDWKDSTKRDSSEDASLNTMILQDKVPISQCEEAVLLDYLLLSTIASCLANTNVKSGAKYI